MTRKQWIVLILLGIGDAIVLGLLGFAMAVGMPAGLLSEPAAVVTPTPSETFTPTPLPTWTPTPIPTPMPPPLPTAPPPPTPRSLTVQQDIMFNEIEQRVIELRGLDRLQPIPRWALGENDLRRRMEATFQDEALRAEIDSLVHVLAALDLMAPEEDLVTVLEEVFSEQVAGFYDTETESIYIVTDENLNRIENRMIFVHEVGHALQDQHFDLESMGLYQTDHAYFFFDRTGALHALVEGDAELVQVEYIEQYLSEQDILALQFATVDIGRTALETAPRVVREAMLFPYVQGLTFATALYDAGGWDQIDAAYARPPSSTEQILHPERYLASDPPLDVTLPNLAPVLGEGWEPIHEATLGEFFLRLHLQNWLEDAEAALAAEGWGGDQLAVYYNAATNQTASVLRLRWDTREDAIEFLLFYTAWAEDRFGHSAGLQTDELNCWEGSDAICLAWDDAIEVTIVRGPDQELVTRILSEGLDQ